MTDIITKNIYNNDKIFLDSTKIIINLKEDKLIKNYFKLSNEDLLKFKKSLKDNDVLLSFVLNDTKDNIIDADIYVRKNKLDNFLASFKFKNFNIIDTKLTLEDEFYFHENKILQQIIINKGLTNILVVDNNYSLNNIISNFLFDITIGYYKEKIYENKNKTNRCSIKYKYTIGYYKRYLSYYEIKKIIYENNKYNIIINSLDDDNIATYKEEYIIKYILNYIFNIYGKFFSLSNKLDFLNFFNKSNYSKFIEDLKILLNNNIDVRRLIFNTIKYILFDLVQIEINQLIFDENQIKINPNIFIQFIIKHNLFAFNHYNYVDLIEYKFKDIVETNIQGYDLELDFFNIIENISNINITKKNIDFKNKTGFDLINQEDINVKKYIKEHKENIVLVLNDKNITLITKEDLDTYVSNINENWLFNCNRDDPEEVMVNPYIQIPTVGGNIFVSYIDLYNLYISTEQIFFFNKTENIEKSQSFKNTLVGQRIGIANYVSANHCQDGSILGIYEISELKLQLQTHSKMKTLSNKSSFFSERKAKSSTKNTF